MSSPEPEKIPLLFPDPVIEYYVQRVDRAAIRERLNMTPEERLQALQREVNARAAQQPLRVREEWPNERAAAMRFTAKNSSSRRPRFQYFSLIR
jgi:hypothetical protein